MKSYKFFLLLIIFPIFISFLLFLTVANVTDNTEEIKSEDSVYNEIIINQNRDNVTPDTEIQDVSNKEMSIIKETATSVSGEVIINQSALPTDVCLIVSDENGEISKTIIENIVEKHKFKLDQIPLKEQYTFIASASGFVSCIKSYDTKNIDNVRLELSKKPTLEICVRTDRELPVSGAKINLSTLDKMLYSETVVSDDRGVAIIELPRNGIFHAVAEHPLYDSVHIRDIEIVTNPNTLDIIMNSSRGIIHGFVKDENDEPIENAKILLLRGKTGNSIRDTYTNKEGTYRIDDIIYGNYFMKVEGSDEYYKSGKNYAPGINVDEYLRPVNLYASDSVREENFYLLKSPFISGIVIDTDGKSVEGATIRTQAKEGRDYVRHIVAKDIITKTDGTFRIPLETRIQTFTRLLLTVFHPKYYMKTKSITNYNWKESQKEITIILVEAKGVIEGVLLDVETNKPIPLYDITLFEEGSAKYSKTSKTIATSLSGEFIFENVQEGKYELTTKEYDIQNKKVECVEDKNNTYEIYGRKITRRETIPIKGIVRSKEDGKPISGASVIYENENYESVTTRTNRDGTFKLDVFKVEDKKEIEIYAIHRKYEKSHKKRVNLEEDVIYEIELNPLPGVIHVVMENKGEAQALRAFIMELDDGSSKEITDLMNGSEIYIKNVNPDQGPYIVTVGDRENMGISNVLSLKEKPDKYIKEKIVLCKKRKTDQSVTIIDVTTGQPVQNALVEIVGHTIRDHGVPYLIKKRTITNEMGTAKFSEMPEYIGTIEIRHGLYKESKQPIKHDSQNTMSETYLTIEPLDELTK